MDPITLDGVYLDAKMPNGRAKLLQSFYPGEKYKEVEESRKQVQKEKAADAGVGTVASGPTHQH